MARKHSSQKEPSAPTPAPAAMPVRFYRRIGNHGWRSSNYFTYSALSPAYRRWLGTALGGTPLEMLSIGCGAGELENYLAASGHRVVGLDLSHPMLKRAARAGLDCAVEADAGALPFGAASFDLAIFPESIGHLALPGVFGEARRVLRPGGMMIVTTYASHLGVHAQYHKYRFAQLAAAASDLGFAVTAKRYLAAKQNSVADAPSDAKATLLYFAARSPAANAPR